MSHKRLDKDNFLEQIVRYGYFAEQFPDCFSSDAFAAHLGVLSKTVAATKAEAGKSRKNTTTPTTLSMYKNVFPEECFHCQIRRLSCDWQNICKHTGRKFCSLRIVGTLCRPLPA